MGELMAALGKLLVISVCLAFTSVHAADTDRQYQVQAIAAVENCVKLNAAVVSAKNDDDWGPLYGFSLYTMGYLTAINRLAEDTYDIAGNKNAKTLLVWLEQYCAENPSETFDGALYRLIAELYPQRRTVGP